MKGAVRSLWLIAVAAVLLAVGWPSVETASAGGDLRAGAGRSDITPPTGFYHMGWVRSDAKSEGQLTRLFARSLVLERGDRKLALVSVDLAFVPAGLVADVVERLAERGFGEESVLISASHTHSAPGGLLQLSGVQHRRAHFDHTDGVRGGLARRPAALHVPGRADHEGDPNGRTRIAPPLSPVGAKPSFSVSPRTARSRAIWPGMASSRSSIRARPNRIRWARGTRSTRR